jgi:NADH dehydrogenase
MHKKKRIIVLGGGFGGVYTALHLEKLFRHRDDYELVLVSRENYFTYQPMLSEIIGGSVGILDMVSSLRSLLKRTHIYVREISSIDTTDQTVILSPNFDHTNLILRYDHLVLAFGTVTDFRYSPGGLHEHALGFKTLSDAIRLRNRLIDVIEAAATESSKEARRQLLTFVVGGGGFSGVEVVAEINDFVRRLVKKYPTLKNAPIQVTLLHSKERLMERELSESLSLYAEKILRKRGVEQQTAR